MEFEQIYNTYFRSVYLYAMQLCGNEHTAEEITSETFFKAIHAIDSFRGDCDMRVWLCQIAKNTYYSYLKKNSKVSHIDEADLQNTADPDALIEAHFSEQAEVRQIRKILHEVSEPYKEIGELYGKTDNWACVTYHRARKMIQRRLEEIEHEK